MAKIQVSTVTLKTIELTPSFIAQCVHAQTNAHRFSTTKNRIY